MRTRIWHSDWKPRWLIRCVSAALLSFMDKQVPDWRLAEEKGEEAQALPVLRDGETARLRDPEIEDKETRPPPRYKEGTLIEAMQNAGHFVEDKALRERLKEAKGIGTPATRGEIIAGLKKQGFLTVREKKAQFANCMHL